MTFFRSVMDYASTDVAYIVRTDGFHNLIDTSGVDMLQCPGTWFLLHNVSAYWWL
jgi:hypothetical protein